MIGRLDRYLGMRFLRMIGMAVLSFVVVFVSVDAFDHMSRWVDRNVSLSTLAKYYFYGLPYIVVLVLPVAVLLCSLFLVTSMARKNELVAIRAAGVSIPRIFLPAPGWGLSSALTRWWQTATGSSGLSPAAAWERSISPRTRSSPRPSP